MFTSLYRDCYKSNRLQEENSINNHKGSIIKRNRYDWIFFITIIMEDRTGYEKESINRIRNHHY
ncbi:hypothetical protein, partial [Eisenbergiella tayi]|uniref:hypothetical protein n=1 Tax=Eisenbergiella tayi TaxID=1432052 RepID=UPI001A9A3F4B